MPNIVDLTDVTLDFEDANSKLLDVVSIVDVDAEERVNNSLVEILDSVISVNNVNSVNGVSGVNGVSSENSVNNVNGVRSVNSV